MSERIVAYAEVARREDGILVTFHFDNWKVEHYLSPDAARYMRDQLKARMAIFDDDRRHRKAEMNGWILLFRGRRGFADRITGPARHCTT